MSIDKMPAGALINIEVLVCVCGFSRRKVFYQDWDVAQEFPYYIPSGKPRRTHSIDARPVPPFSADLTTAWAAAERLSEGHGCAFGVAQRYPITVKPRYAAYVKGGALAYKSPSLEVYGHADTAALALCRALLKAIKPKGA